MSRKATWSIGAACIVAGLLLLYPSDAIACHSATVCVEWGVTAIDAGFGEDYGTEDTVPARGGRITLIPPPTEHPQELYLDNNGCFTFFTEHVEGFRLLIYNDAILTDLNGGIIRVRAFENLAEKDAEGVFYYDADLTIVPGETETIESPPTLRFNLLAWAVHTIHQVNVLQTMPPVGSAQIRIYVDEDSEGGSVDLSVRSDLLKFLIAHEVGHWLQQNWNDDPGDALVFDYAHTGIDEPCQFAVEPNGGAPQHGIRSGEFASGALVEGVAHFVAAVAFNAINEPDGIFRYYKDMDTSVVPSYIPFEMAGNRVSLLFDTEDTSYGGTRAWVRDVCTSDWDVTNGEINSEMDWMRFLWRFLTDKDPNLNPQPGLYDIFNIVRRAHAGDKWPATQVWDDLLQAFDANPDIAPFKARFESLGLTEGVVHP